MTTLEYSMIQIFNVYLKKIMRLRASEEGKDNGNSYNLETVQFSNVWRTSAIFVIILRWKLGKNEKHSHYHKKFGTKGPTACSHQSVSVFWSNKKQGSTRTMRSHISQLSILILLALSELFKWLQVRILTSNFLPYSQQVNQS